MARAEAYAKPVPLARTPAEGNFLGSADSEPNQVVTRGNAVGNSGRVVNTPAPGGVC